MDQLFAVSAPGLEAYTLQELLSLELLDPTNAASGHAGTSPDTSPAETGGVAFAGGARSIYLANLWLRTASRVLLRFADFNAAAFSELEKKAGRLPWEDFLAPGRRVALRVTCHKSRLYHSDAVARTLVKAIGRRLGRPLELVKYDEDASSDSPQLVIVRLLNDHCSLSLDTSGAGLHRRGYRLAAAKAPLRETLAAGMLLASGWDGVSPLLDPFCGSGTIPIEAALMSCQAAPGSRRRFAFMDWPGYDQALWESLLAESKNKFRSQSAPITASDRDAGAVDMARSNAERAGVADCIDFSCRAVSAIEPAGTGWVVTNPPYGIRVSSNKDLRSLYAQLGNVLRRKCPGWRLNVLCSDYQLLGNIGLSLDTHLTFVNGGIPVKFARGTIKAEG
jgi:putative N6-adenine-specific DNA methylase